MRRLIAVFGRQVDTFNVQVLLVVCSLVVCGVVGECPQDVQARAYSCFTDYSSQYQNMQNSRYKMCCGVDVETLRAFCSSFMGARRCLENLKGMCPVEKYREIEQTKMNIKGAEKGLQELCSDDHIYEKYARHQNCFAMQGPISEECLSTYMNNNTIRLMSKVQRKTKEELCRDMMNAINCIKPNIQAMCGLEAAKLVEKLVTPMVWDSSQCDYNVIHIEATEKPRHHHPKHTMSPTDDKNKYITDNRNSASHISTSHMLSLIVILTVYLFQQAGH